MVSFMVRLQFDLPYHVIHIKRKLCNFGSHHVSDSDKYGNGMIEILDPKTWKDGTKNVWDEHPCMLTTEVPPEQKTIGLFV